MNLNQMDHMEDKNEYKNCWDSISNILYHFFF